MVDEVKDESEVELMAKEFAQMKEPQAEAALPDAASAVRQVRIRDVSHDSPYQLPSNSVLEH